MRAGKILLQAANDGTLEEVLIKKSQEDTVSGRRMSVSQLGGSIPYLIPFPKTRVGFEGSWLSHEDSADSTPETPGQPEDGGPVDAWGRMEFREQRRKHACA